MILSEEEITALLEPISTHNQEFKKHYPGTPVGRKPVHTVYGGAQLYIAERTKKIGTAAAKIFEKYVDNFVEFAQILQIPGYQNLPTKPEKIEDLKKELQSEKKRDHNAWLAFTVYQKVKNKLQMEAVEDFRIDFEDGFGLRTNQEEDHYAELTAQETAKAMSEGILSPFIGIRIKPLTEELKYRSIRTLNIYLSTLLEQTKGQLPNNFVITLPKVSTQEEVRTLCDILDKMENKLELASHSLKIEIMVETPQALINSKGQANLAQLHDAGRERIVGAHFGVYDYTASVDIIAKHQEMDHLVCDFARHLMKVTFSGTGVRLSDGATNTLPIGPYRPDEGQELTQPQKKENRRVVHSAWKKGYDHIIHSLTNGYYQGWDLHPAQLPIRYAAIYTFFLEHLQESIHRLQSFVKRAAQATLTGDVFDDAATALALLNYFNLAWETQAISEEEVKETGLTLEEIHEASFQKILESR